MAYGIHFLSDRPAGDLVPARPGGATGAPPATGQPGWPVPAGLPSTEGDLPPMTRLAASGASRGSTAADRWGEDRLTETSA